MSSKLSLNICLDKPLQVFQSVRKQKKYYEEYDTIFLLVNLLKLGCVAS